VGSQNLTRNAGNLKGGLEPSFWTDSYTYWNDYRDYKDSRHLQESPGSLYLTHGCTTLVDGCWVLKGDSPVGATAADAIDSDDVGCI